MKFQNRSDGNILKWWHLKCMKWHSESEVSLERCAEWNFNRNTLNRSFTYVSWNYGNFMNLLNLKYRCVKLKKFKRAHKWKLGTLIGAGSSYSTKNLDLPVMILFLIILEHPGFEKKMEIRNIHIPQRARFIFKQHRRKSKWAESMSHRFSSNIWAESSPMSWIDSAHGTQWPVK